MNFLPNELRNTSLHKSHNDSLLLLWAPCIGTLLYLSGSLLLFKFGPIDWPIKNEREFWSFNALYLLMFFLGYRAALWQRHWWAVTGQGTTSQEFSARFFWPVCACAAIVVLIGHRNITLSPSYIPTTLVSNFMVGLADPLSAYLYKLSDEAKSNFSGNPLVTLIFGTLAFSKLVLVYILTASWPSLSFWKRTLGTAVAIFPLVSGICVGTNKPGFDVLFVFATIILAHVFMTPHAQRLQFIKARRSLILLTIFIFLFAGSYFRTTMHVRAPGLDYAAKSLHSTAGVIRVKQGFQMHCETSDQMTAGACHLFSIGTIYLTQGYYGMSLSLGIPLDTTYGLGHSSFITGALQKYLGVDLTSRTFQQKIHTQWSATAQWHSAYSQWANDVGFTGVAFVMLALGFYVCAIWTSALITHNVAAVCSIPLLATLIVFIPANNQVFNMFESLVTFIVLLIAWVVGLATGPRTRRPLHAS